MKAPTISGVLIRKAEPPKTRTTAAGHEQAYDHRQSLLRLNTPSAGDGLALRQRVVISEKAEGATTAAPSPCSERAR